GTGRHIRGRVPHGPGDGLPRGGGRPGYPELQREIGVAGGGDGADHRAGDRATGGELRPQPGLVSGRRLCRGGDRALPDGAGVSREYTLIDEYACLVFECPEEEIHFRGSWSFGGTGGSTATDSKVWPNPLAADGGSPSARSTSSAAPCTASPSLMP